MRSGFLIFGLTGPLGSGCSETAKFLAGGLPTYKLKVKDEIPEVQAALGKYYRYLRELQDKVYDAEIEKKLKIKDLYEEPEEYLNNIKEYDKKINDFSEEHRKIINRKIRRIIERREIFKIYNEMKVPNFTVISMSDMIIKLCIEKSLDKNGEMSEELKKYKDLPDSLKNKFVDFAKKNIEDIDFYNKIIKEKKYVNIPIR